MAFWNGTRAVTPPHCRAGSPTNTGASDNLGSSSTALTAQGGGPFPTNSWVEDAHYYLFGSITYISGYWIVPSAPLSSDGQIIYLWIGTEDNLGFTLPQPVLQWGPDPYSGCTNGGNYWGIAAYYISGTSCYVSTLASVNVGDTIFGTAEETGLCGHSCQSWTIFIQDITTGATSQLSIQTDSQSNAYATLEVWNVMSCSDYPGSGQTGFSGLNVGGGTPGWSGNVITDDGCGEKVTINSQGNPSQVNLVYSTNPSSGSGSGSLARGTLISMASGVAVPVQELKIGDRMLGYDPAVNHYMLSTVTSIEVVQTDSLLVIHTSSGLPLRTDASPTEILWTRLVDGSTRWLPVTVLRPGDSLFTPEGWVLVTRIDHSPGQYTMYDVTATLPYFANGYLDPPNPSGPT